MRNTHRITSNVQQIDRTFRIPSSPARIRSGIVRSDGFLDAVPQDRHAGKAATEEIADRGRDKQKSR